MKVDHPIGRLVGSDMSTMRLDVLNLCYQGSAEEIVDQRLLKRLEDVQPYRGDPTNPTLPATSDEFRALADGLISEAKLLSLATHRAKEQREHSWIMDRHVEAALDRNLMTASK